MKKAINFWSFVKKDVYEAMDIAKDAGFEGIELTLEATGDLTPNSTPEQLAKIKAYADNLGLKIHSLASGLCWGPSFTSDDPAEVDEAYDMVCNQLRCAAALGADVILVIPGSVGVDFVPNRPIVPYDVCYERALKQMKRLMPVAEKYGVCVGIENVGNKFLLSPLEMRDFTDGVGQMLDGVDVDLGVEAALGTGVLVAADVGAPLVHILLALIILQYLGIFLDGTITIFLHFRDLICHVILTSLRIMDGPF